jgi:hypothetical protein
MLKEDALAKIQTAIVNNIVEDSGDSLDEIAKKIDVHASQISNYKKAARRMKLDEIATWILRYGSGPVLGPLAALDGSRIAGGVSNFGDAEGEADEVQRLMIRLSARITDARDPDGDGGKALTAEERSGLRLGYRRLIAQLQAADAALDGEAA